MKAGCIGRDIRASSFYDFRPIFALDVLPGMMALFHGEVFEQKSKKRSLCVATSINLLHLERCCH